MHADKSNQKAYANHRETQRTHHAFNNDIVRWHASQKFNRCMYNTKPDKDLE